jgi:hypothetical protein
VFVADVIPDELAAVIEFLNTRMHDTEVFGVEVRRYGGGGEQPSASCPVSSAPQPPPRPRSEARHRWMKSCRPPNPLSSPKRSACQSGPPRPVSGSPTRWAAWYSLTHLPDGRVPLDLLYRGGRQAEISQLLETLQQIAGTSRKVSAKSPNIGVREALEHWDTIAEIIRTLVRIRAENTSPLPDK